MRIHPMLQTSHGCDHPSAVKRFRRFMYISACKQFDRSSKTRNISVAPVDAIQKNLTGKISLTEFY